MKPNVVDSIISEARSIGFAMSCDDETGSLLSTLAASKYGGSFLEIGTGAGVSTSYILEGMSRNSTLISVDLDEKAQSVAKKHLSQDNRVTFYTIDGETYILENQDKQFDFIFADSWPGKFYVVEETLRLLSPGGFYIIDDLLPVSTWREEHTEKVNQLMDYLNQRKELKMTYLNWSTGLIVAVKKETEDVI
jgi:predicted O-methyltransferase YrrM